MRRLFLFCLVLLLVSPCLAAKPKALGADAEFGKLTVFSDVIGSDIYVDAKFIGQDRATISNMPVGKHYVRVVKAERTIQSGLVDVKEGDETIIVAKPTEDELLANIRKPSHVLIFGSMTGVGYNEVNPNGTYNLTYRPQYGVGTEVKLAVPVVDVNIDLGFFLNYPSALIVGNAEAQMAISSPYVCVTKEFLKAGPFKLNAGGGLNYGIFNPGGGTNISIASRIGYMAYIEGMRNITDNQKLDIKLGYAVYNGRSSVRVGTTTGYGDVSCAGLFLTAGVAYQL